MGNRRLGNKRLEAALDNFFGSATMNGVNGSPFVLKDPDRYYVEEFFADGLPQLNATIDGIYTAEAARLASRTVELAGDNAADGYVTRAATGAGINLAASTNGHVAIVTGHQDASTAALGLTKWGSETQLEFETLIRTQADIDELTIGAGWKLAANIADAAVFNFATDDNSCYFAYGASDDDTGTLADNTALYFISNHGAGNDVRVKLPITVAANTSYRLGITVDSARKVSAWVNGVQYSLKGTATAGEYNSTGAGTELSAALSNDIDFLPMVGVEIEAGNARGIQCSYMKCSRIAFDNA